MKSNARFYRVFATILLVAFLVRLAGACYWQRAVEADGELFRLGDSHSYWTLASQLGQGLPYQYGSPDSRIFRTPLYPLLLAPLTTCSDPFQAVWWARVLGCMLGTLAVGLVGIAAYRIGGRLAALWASLLAAFYPSAVGMSIVVLSEALFLPLMVAHLLLWQSAWRAADGKRLLIFGTLAGWAAGAATLTRPSWLLFVPFAFGVGLLFGGQRKRHAIIFACSILGLSCVMSPWWIRSALITGRFVPTTLQVGPSLYDGLHEGATGASDEGMQFMVPIIAEQIRQDQQRQPEQLVSTLEYRINARAQKMALEWAANNLLEMVELAGRKFLRIWTLWPDGGELASSSIRLAITLSCFSVLMLAIYQSFALSSSFHWIYGICWLPCIYFTLLHMVFVGSVRYREPAVFVLVALAGCAVATLASRRVNSVFTGPTC